MAITNRADVNPLIAAWLLVDDYERRPGRENISATGLLKSVRQAVLGQRLEAGDRDIDVLDLLASRRGTAIHDSVEKAWRSEKIVQALRALGYPQHVAENLKVNPTDEEIADNDQIIPVWMELRRDRKIDGYTVSGKFDTIIDGRLLDIKSTSVWTWIFGSKEEDYRIQGSIYRWLNPTLVTGDHIHIQFIFMDWSRLKARFDPTYPKHPVMEMDIELMSIPETEAWIKAKLRALTRHWDTIETELPYCTPKELWMKESEWKYYSDPNKLTKATKNFKQDSAGAYAHQAQLGKGVVIEVKGEAKACEYCPAFNICTQKDLYHAAP